MSEFLPVKPIYTGTDVVALGEAAPDDVMLSPGGGIKFPDGSLQITAGGGGGSSGTLVEESPPTAAPTSLWFESDSGRMYLKYKNPDDAEVWVEANVAGVRGEVGPAGEQGVVGPAGPQGDMGLTGPAGADGAAGIQGPAGADGAVGPQGPAGADGVAGPAGADGAAGVQGEVGPQGPAGADGAAGIQGPAGADGAPGAQGPAGLDSQVPGPQGPAGLDGAGGPQGPGGPEGPMGPQGPAGGGVPPEASGIGSFMVIRFTSVGSDSGGDGYLYQGAVQGGVYTCDWVLDKGTGNLSIYGGGGEILDPNTGTYYYPTAGSWRYEGLTMTPGVQSRNGWAAGYGVRVA